MYITGFNIIPFNNILRNNTDTKVKYINTQDIQSDNYAKSAPTQPEKAPNVSFGSFKPGVSKFIKIFSIFKEIVSNFLLKMKLPKGAKKYKDGNWHAQEIVSSGGATPIMKHVNSLNDVGSLKNPWGFSDIFRETIYNPLTKNKQIYETRGDRFSTLKVISSNGKCIYIVLDSNSAGKIVYEGYNNKFQPISGVVQSITCLDKDNIVLAKFNEKQIEQGYNAYEQCHCDQDYVALGLFDVKNLKKGPPADKSCLGDFNQIVQNMGYLTTLK